MEATQQYLESRFPSFMNSNTLQLVRSLLGLPCTCLWLMTVARFNPLSHFVFMTLWGLIISWVCTALSIYVASGQTQSKAIRFITQQLLQFILGMQVMITAVYWISIHEVLMKTKPEMTESLIAYWLQCLIHVIPLLCVSLNIILSNIRFSYFDSFYTILIATVFMCVNCFAVRTSGIVLYHFLTWDSFESVKTAAQLVGVSYVVNLISCFLVNLLPYKKGHTKKLQ